MKIREILEELNKKIVSITKANLTSTVNKNCISQALCEIAEEICRELEKMKKDFTGFSEDGCQESDVLRINSYNQALSDTQSLIKKICEVGK